MISTYILICFLAVAALRHHSALDHTTEHEDQEAMEAEGVRRPAMG